MFSMFPRHSRLRHDRIIRLGRRRAQILCGVAATFLCTSRRRDTRVITGVCRSRTRRKRIGARSVHSDGAFDVSRARDIYYTRARKPTLSASAESRT